LTAAAQPHEVPPAPLAQLLTAELQQVDRTPAAMAGWDRA